MQLDDFGKIALERYTALVNAYNEQVKRSKSIDSKDDFAEDFMQNAPELQEFNNRINEVMNVLDSLKEQRKAAAEPLVEAAYQEAVASSGIDPEALKAQRSQVTTTAKYLTSMYGDDVLKETPKVEALRSGTSTGSSGTRRIHGFDVYVDGVIATQKNKDGVLKSTFTAASKVLGVETIDLQRAFFKEAGSEDPKAEDFPALVKFEFTDKDGNIRNIQAMKVGDSEDEAAEDDDSSATA